MELKVENIFKVKGQRVNFQLICMQLIKPLTNKTQYCRYPQERGAALTQKVEVEAKNVKKPYINSNKNTSKKL